MAAEVLRAKSEIERARIELRRRGISSNSPWWERMMRKLGIAKGITVGEHVKSWDLLKTVDFIEKNISKSAPILDIGAYSSEILCVLHRLNYSNLTGIDLNPKIKLMPYGDAIRYEVSDFMHTPFEKESFEVITAISAIEHGFNSQALLAEVSRLLRPGGYFIASFDYWPEKIDTSGIEMFGLDWRIFSEHEVLGFIEEAKKYKLAPFDTVNLKAQNTIVSTAKRSYTFAWLALKKDS